MICQHGVVALWHMSSLDVVYKKSRQLLRSSLEVQPLTHPRTDLPNCHTLPTPKTLHVQSDRRIPPTTLPPTLASRAMAVVMHRRLILIHTVLSDLVLKHRRHRAIKISVGTFNGQRLTGLLGFRGK